MRALLLLLVAGQPIGDRWHDRIRPQPAGPPLFAFAPSGGTGMGAACACTTPTGAKGEALTFTRASSGTCLKSGTTTGIANGDLVTCATNQPRVMPGGDGSGGPGLLVEGPRTNDRLRSEELENAAYTLANGGAAGNIVVTADATNGPCGTPGASCGMAERLQVPATTTGQYSILHQNQSLVGTWSCGVFFKGVSGSGEVGIAVYDNTTGGGMYQCARCSYVAGSWSRCAKENVISGGINATFWIGNGTSLCNDGAHAAADVYAWGVQCEAGAFLSSYIRTTSAAVTRAAETATFPLVLSNVTGSIAATAVPESPNLPDALDHGIVALSTAGPSYGLLVDYRASVGTYTFYSAAGGGVSLVGALPIPSRIGGFWNSAADVHAFMNASSTSGTWVGVVSTTLIEIGAYSAGQQAYSVIKLVCVDPSSGRCR